MTRYPLLIPLLIPLLAAVLLAGTGLAQSDQEPAPDPPRRPNIVWITIDDVGCDFGIYGNTLVPTPNIDALGARGQVFTRSFVAVPVCSPSRSALITGCHAPTIGQHQHRSSRPLPEGVEPVTDIFRRAGYRVTKLPARRVKLDAFLDGEAAPMGSFESLTGHTKQDFNFDRGRGGATFEEWKADSDAPFFALIDFNPQKGPARWAARFAEQTQVTVDPADVTIQPYWPDTPQMRARIALYHEAIAALDADVGRVLDWLERDDLAKDTVVVLWGDHGAAQFRHKQWCYDSGLRVPLVIAGPGIEPAVRDDLVSAIDIAPSSLTLAGIDVPEYIEGRDMFDRTLPARRYVFASRDRCDETEDRVRAIRDERFKLIWNLRPELAYIGRNAYTRRAFLEVRQLLAAAEAGTLTDMQRRWVDQPRPAWELYDLDADPNELNNVVDSDVFAEDLARLCGRLETWVERVDAHNPAVESLETIVPDRARKAVRAQRAAERQR